MNHLRSTKSALLRRTREALAVALLVALAAPATALADSGKKFFKKGVEAETAQRWEQAAEQFALAVADDPGNTEYRLHYARALTSASLMFTERGDTLASQKDYEAAYQAYRKAASYDESNELAIAKMKSMLRILGRPEPEPGPESELLQTNYRRAPVASIEIPAQNRVKTDVVFRDTKLKIAVDTLASSLGLNVIYDSDFKEPTGGRFDFEARNITQAKALELILQTNKLFYTQADSRTIIIAPDTPQSRVRYQNLAVRTFYLRNADLQETRGLIQQVVQSKQVVTLKQLNSITVRDTPNNLDLIESLIASIDKDRAEVLIDVNLYEVTRSDLLQLGNQFATSGNGSVSFFGGVGAASSIRDKAATGLFGPAGIALALPTSQLTALQGKGRSRLLASSQIHVLDGEQHTIRIGSRVPIKTAVFSTNTINLNTGRNNDGTNNNNGNNNNVNNLAGLGGFGGPAEQFQYENVGLNIDVKPVVREDQVQLTMKIETSAVGEAGVGGNPTFTQRQLSSVASIRDGQTTMIAGVAQESKNESRQGLPLIGLIPVVGRFFSIPQKENRTTDVVIMVTPHITRAPVYSKEDHVAIAAGTQTSTDRQISIEEIVYRAQIEEAEAAQAPLAAAPRKPAAPRQTVMEVRDPSAPPASSTTRPVRAGSGETIRTPGGMAAPPVVAPEESAPAGPGPRMQPAPAAVPDDEDIEDEDEDEDDGASVVPASGGAARDAGETVSVRLAALQTASPGKPMMVSVLGTGGSAVASGKIAIKFNNQILRVNKVESTGVFDGKFGGPIPYEVRDNMLVLTLNRPSGAVPLNGQIVSIAFDVLGSGNATLALSADDSQFLSANGVGLGITSAGPIQVAAR